MTREAANVREFRRFGMTVGAVLAGIGLWPMLWHGAAPRLWALAAAGVLILAAGIAPRALAPVHRGWMALGHALGWINTRIILTLFFYGILTPMGLAARLFGKDFMRVRIASDAESYRVIRERRPATHLWHQF
ncbi:SxtJ family membrane protein [Nitrospira moscoviensis]|uniref:SxtJ n=1 Tax=Nitrospira moscoviensis TaxID=42253 RepID=A0A0K2GDV8_NITMO|nr:SxtJ family membrane protein [Nitrospira moscoviensis]ALA59039.1 conserved membrane protein of unknown function [Nitrospira moscoviensis]